MKIGVIGAGNWGTALANLLAEKGFGVTLWAYETEVAEAICKKHKNPLYLPKVRLSSRLKATPSLEEAVEGRGLIVFVVPSHVARVTAEKLRPYLKKGVIFTSCTKGIEIGTGKLISEVLNESLPHIPKAGFCYLSGPSFAKEVARHLPTTVVVASSSPKTAGIVQKTLRNDYFMPFTSSDIIGVQIGGAVKNVIAIACGISDGLGFGHNTRAAIITRGLYEMIKIGKMLGASPLTFAGLAGIGDLVLTCTSTTSRNHQVGFQIGKGKNLRKILSRTKEVAEGVATSRAINHLAKKLELTVPICTEIYRILYKNKPLEKAVADLTGATLHEEMRGVL